MKGGDYMEGERRHCPFLHRHVYSDSTECPCCQQTDAYIEMFLRAANEERAELLEDYKHCGLQAKTACKYKPYVEKEEAYRRKQELKSTKV